MRLMASNPQVVSVGNMYTAQSCTLLSHACFCSLQYAFRAALGRLGMFPAGLALAVPQVEWEHLNLPAMGKAPQGTVPVLLSLLWLDFVTPH